jgi:hypothetical protein
VSGGVSLAVLVAVLVVVCAAGFVVGDRMPLRRGERRFDGCRVILWRSGSVAEFRVVAGRRTIGCSESFEVPSGPLPDDGDIRLAHDELLARLGDLGWEPAAVQIGRWYETRLAQRTAIPA